MSSWKHLGQVSAALVPTVLAGCCAHPATRPYHEIPYCCDRTAGSGVEYYCLRQVAEVATTPALTIVQDESPPPPAVEPAAGDKMFHNAVMKH